MGEVGHVTEPGHIAEALMTNRRDEELGYSFSVIQNPKVGSKAPKVVPFLSNCFSGVQLPRVVHAYHKLANGIDTANQLAREHREVGRFKTWSTALLSIMLRYAMVHIFTLSPLSALIPVEKSFWDFQWDLFASTVGAHTPTNMHHTCIWASSTRQRTARQSRGSVCGYCPALVDKGDMGTVFAFCTKNNEVVMDRARFSVAEIRTTTWHV